MIRDSSVVGEVFASGREPQRGYNALPHEQRYRRQAHTAVAIRVPTLMLHRGGDRTINVEEDRFLANHIKAPD
jgi:hypothetical protein